MCVTVGFALFVAGLFVGPFFAVFIGLTVSYELMFAFPRARAFYRAQSAARQLPLLLETLGHQVQTGLSFESALARSLAQVPAGALAEQVGTLVHKVERGGNLHDGLEELSDLCRLPDFRLFTQVAKLFGRGGVLNGEAFVELALFLRKYRESLSQLQRRAQVQRAYFLLFVGLLAVCAALYAVVVPGVFAPPASVALGLVRELGACAVLLMVLIAMRMTSAFSFEGHEQI
jgi:Flp pilus assembly protein TadB